DNAGETLPRVRYFEAWNEPNLWAFLTPVRSGGKLKNAEHYRKMLNAFYDAVKDVKGGNKVVAPATSPFGDSSGKKRSRPVEFIRELFCLKGKKNPKPKSNCKTSELPKLDIVSHHPINILGKPTRSAKDPDDASSPDMDRIGKAAKAAAKAGNILPVKSNGKSKKRPLWATEFFWFSDPPDKRDVATNLNKQASRIVEALYLLWEDGVKTAVYLGLRDSPNFGSGLFFDDGEAKPALDAFRFPFVGDRKSKKKIKVWGKAPANGKLKVQEKKGSKWKTIKRFNVKEGKVFYKSVKLKGKAKIRGELKGETTHPWTQKK
ncbi:MAG: hypothetical protein ACR2N5_01050, partial [Solirubrobacterales bacterium]